MKVKGINKTEFKKALKNKTSCDIQYNGWTCGTCFFDISNALKNSDWQSLLLYRGDTEKEDLHNLPEKPKDSIIKIWKLIK